MMRILQFLRKQASNYHYFSETIQIKTIQILRWGLCIAILMFALFGSFDNLTFDYYFLYAIRFGIVIPLLLVCLGLTYVNYFVRNLQIIAFAAVLVSSLGCVAAISIGEGAHLNEKIYFSNLLVCMVFFPVVLGLNTFFTIVSCCLTIIILNVSIWSSSDSPTFVPENVVLVTSAIIGCLFQYLLSRLLKANAMNVLQLQRQKFQIEKSREDLLLSDNIKNKLLWIISHDIRGPLASIKGILLLLRTERISKAEFNQHTHKLGLLLQGTDGMLDNLLHWSLSQYCTESTKRVECNVQELVQSTLKLFEYQAAMKGTQLINNIDDNFKVIVDPALIGVVFRNIISNAVKFTRSGVIIVRSSIYDTSITFDFIDNGVGMDQADLKKLFQWDRITSIPGTNNERGTGLGLLLCKDFIERHEGSIYIASQKWLGTTVTVELPIERYVPGTFVHNPAGNLQKAAT